MAGHAQLKVCHDRMLEDTNSLDGAHILFILLILLHGYIQTFDKFYENDNDQGVRKRCMLTKEKTIFPLL